jgi:hypothetical protein
MELTMGPARRAAEHVLPRRAEPKQGYWSAVHCTFHVAPPDPSSTHVIEYSPKPHIQIPIWCITARVPSSRHSYSLASAGVAAADTSAASRLALTPVRNLIPKLRDEEGEPQEPDDQKTCMTPP